MPQYFYNTYISAPEYKDVVLRVTYKIDTTNNGIFTTVVAEVYYSGSPVYIAYAGANIIKIDYDLANKRWVLEGLDTASYNDTVKVTGFEVLLSN